IAGIERTPEWWYRLYDSLAGVDPDRLSGAARTARWGSLPGRRTTTPRGGAGARGPRRQGRRAA
ncbi:hypothetical protein AB0892_24890, partial [Streptomyces sp. NPDC005409]|uniref:hypothetical protein n=1 Tax=Streptomyces sp. NPDC005409 TaxID=3155342 RepID=UPI003452E3A3